MLTSRVRSAKVCISYHLAPIKAIKMHSRLSIVANSMEAQRQNGFQFLVASLLTGTDFQPWRLFVRFLSFIIQPPHPYHCSVLRTLLSSALPSLPHSSSRWHSSGPPMHQHCSYSESFCEVKGLEESWPFTQYRYKVRA